MPTPNEFEGLAGLTPQQREVKANQYREQIEAIRAEEQRAMQVYAMGGRPKLTKALLDGMQNKAKLGLEFLHIFNRN